MQYPELRAAGYHIGSGSVESACKAVRAYLEERDEVADDEAVFLGQRGSHSIPRDLLPGQALRL